MEDLSCLSGTTESRDFFARQRQKFLLTRYIHDIGTYAIPQGGFPLDPEVFQQLCEADWGAIGAELLAFAIWRVKLYRWQSGSHFEFGPGSTPEDVVQRVIEKTLSGERHWDPAKGPLVPWLKDQVKSVIDALATSAPSRREVLAIERDEEDQEEKELAVQPATQEKSLLTAERVNALFQAVSDDRELFSTGHFYKSF